MWKRTKTLTACMFAAAWWGIFYPELCFSESTCELMQEGEILPDGAEAVDIWRASGEELVIGSRFLEWVEKTLDEGKISRELTKE